MVSTYWTGLTTQPYKRPAEIPCEALVLAPGHSARDTFEMLHGHGVAMRQKPFAMGVRVEHPQDLIDRSQYGPSAGHPSLPAADYKLVCNFGLNRAAYSFCMCPGGEVIQCSSEEGGVVVNGMSNEKRDSGFANSGLVAKVNTADFGSDHLLGGMYFQRKWEQAAFRAAGETYGAPAMAVQDFLKGRATGRLPRTSFKPFAVAADLRTCLPDFVREQLAGALPTFDKKIHGFASGQAILLAIESRTSSPIQLLRGEDGQSVSHPGLYPCGEGAGFAGGITSAAVDGIRVAVETLPPFLMAGVRFLVAGGLLAGWLAATRGFRTTAQQWRDNTITGTFLLLGGNRLGQRPSRPHESRDAHDPESLFHGWPPPGGPPAFSP